MRVVEEAFENYQSDARLPLHTTHRNCVTPQLEAGVVRDIEKSLTEWKSVCRLLRIDQAGQIVSFLTSLEFADLLQVFLPQKVFFMTG